MVLQILIKGVTITARNIVVSIKNSLLSSGIIRELQTTDYLVPCEDSLNFFPGLAEVIKADVCLAEVSGFDGEDFSKRMYQVAELKQLVPTCKSVLLVDDIAYPDLAANVQKAKADGLIDGFLFTTVTPSYLKAFLASI